MHLHEAAIGAIYEVLKISRARSEEERKWGKIAVASEINALQLEYSRIVTTHFKIYIDRKVKALPI